jgi:hypothetical protein
MPRFVFYRKKRLLFAKKRYVSHKKRKCPALTAACRSPPPWLGYGRRCAHSPSRLYLYLSASLRTLCSSQSISWQPDLTGGRGRYGSPSHRIYSILGKGTERLRIFGDASREYAPGTDGIFNSLRECRIFTIESHSFQYQRRGGGLHRFYVHGFNTLN